MTCSFDMINVHDTAALTNRKRYSPTAAFESGVTVIRSVAKCAAIAARPLKNPACGRSDGAVLGPEGDAALCVTAQKSLDTRVLERAVRMLRILARLCRTVLIGTAVRRPKHHRKRSPVER